MARIRLIAIGLSFTPAAKSGFFIGYVEALCLFRLNINRCKTVKYLKNTVSNRNIWRIFTYTKTQSYETFNRANCKRN